MTPGSFACASSPTRRPRSWRARAATRTRTSRSRNAQRDRRSSCASSSSKPRRRRRRAGDSWRARPRERRRLRRATLGGAHGDRGRRHVRAAGVGHRLRRRTPRTRRGGSERFRGASRVAASRFASSRAVRSRGSSSTIAARRAVVRPRDRVVHAPPRSAPGAARARASRTPAGGFAGRSSLPAATSSRRRHPTSPPRDPKRSRVGRRRHTRRAHRDPSRRHGHRPRHRRAPPRARGRRRAARRRQRRRREPRERQTDDLGRYRLEGVPAGPFTLRVQKDGFRLRMLSGLRVASGGRSPAGRDAVASSTAVPRWSSAASGRASLGRRRGSPWAVFPGSPAEHAGLLAGDRIVAIDGREHRRNVGRRRDPAPARRRRDERGGLGGAPEDG